MPDIATIIILTLFPLCMIFAGVSDMFTMTISNKISLGLIGSFFVVALIFGMSISTVGMHLLAGFVVLLFSFTFYAFGWIGGGDAKLYAATAIWMGWPNMFEYILLTSFLGGVLTFVLVSMRSWPIPHFLKKQSWFSRVHAVENGIPYGVALAVGGLAIYPYSSIFSLLTF